MFRAYNHRYAMLSVGWRPTVRPRRRMSLCLARGCLAKPNHQPIAYQTRYTRPFTNRRAKPTRGLEHLNLHRACDWVPSPFGK
jgi:hypothetical protein